MLHTSGHPMPGLSVIEQINREMRRDNSKLRKIVKLSDVLDDCNLCIGEHICFKHENTFKALMSLLES